MIVGAQKSTPNKEKGASECETLKCAVIKSTWRRDHHTNFMKFKQKGVRDNLGTWRIDTIFFLR